MTEVIAGRSFVGLSLPGDGSTLSGLSIQGCTFDGCGLSATREVSNRLTVKEVLVADCRTNHVRIGPALIDTVTVSNLVTKDPLFVWGACLRHVVLRGRVGRIVFRNQVSPATATDAEEAAFQRANQHFYESVDWALDVSQAEFVEADLEGLPARLVRRDSQTQVVVSRAKALEGRWRSLDLRETWWDVLLHRYANAQGIGTRADDGLVLVAPKRHRRYQALLEGLYRLRDAGVAEPD